MDKLFTPNKWFVLFCALFIAVFVCLQMVIRTRLEAYAKAVGDEIFTWSWADRQMSAKGQMTDAKILKRSENDAVVEVSGEQTFSPLAIDQNAVTTDSDKAKSAKKETAQASNNSSTPPTGKSTTSPGTDQVAIVKIERNPCKAVLTFYKLKNDWKLGKVELQ